MNDTGTVRHCFYATDLLKIKSEGGSSVSGDHRSLIVDFFWKNIAIRSYSLYFTVLLRDCNSLVIRKVIIKEYAPSEEYVL